MKKHFKKAIGVLLLLSVIFTQVSFVSAQTDSNSYVVIDIEVFTLGQGYFILPVQIPYTEGDTAADITVKLFTQNKIDYDCSGSLEEGNFYLKAIKGADNGTVNIPEYITKKGGPSNTDNIGNEDEYLGEFDYSTMSGWMITVNNEMIPVGAASFEVKPNDVIRWQYTLWGYGADLGCNTGWGEPAYYTEANKTNLLRTIATTRANYPELVNDSAYTAALQVAQTYTSTDSDVTTANTNLSTVVANEAKKTNTTQATEVKQLDSSISDITKSVSDYMLASVPSPEVGSIGGEWAVLELARSGYMTDAFKNTYIDNATDYVKEKKGVLHSVKYTEYSRVIIALTAIGQNPKNFAGYDLVAPLSDYKATIRQGINGAIYALIAMDCGEYEFEPVADASKEQNSRDKLIDFILGKELETGGWTLAGESADPDITSMAIQSLAKYYDSNEQVKAAVDRALDQLSELQNSAGGFESWSTVNSESIAQVICALCALGIDPATDTRFIKEDGSWLLSALMQFAIPTAQGLSFAHADDTTNQMATEQAGYAIVAYNRLLNGQSGLYQMTVSDEVLNNNVVVATGECGLIVPGAVSNLENTTFNASIRVGSFAEKTKVLQAVLEVSPYLEVLNISTDKTLCNGTLDYNVAEGKLRIVYGDFNTNKELNLVADFPCDLFTIAFRIKQTIPAGEKLTISLTDMKEMQSSEEVVVLNDISGVKEIPLKTLSVTAKIIYQGNGTDLIPADKSAVKLTFTGLDTTTKQIGFTAKNVYSTLYYSDEFTKLSGLRTYVCVVDSTTTLQDLTNIENYQIFEDQDTDMVRFGDTNNDNYIDAQDALNVVAGWLRKGNLDVTSKVILSYNVNGDQGIDTLDALSIVENFIASKQFKVMSY